MPPSRPWRGALAVGLIAILAQAFAIRDVLLWDDLALVGRDDLYTSASRWVESVTLPLGRETFYWRPAATTSFLLESLVHGGAAWGFRLTAAVLHGAVSAVAFVLLVRLLRNRAAALIAALAFALHPVNVETVTWISARFDLLAGLFCLCALAAMPAGAAPRWRWLLACACAVAACWSKENAFVLPALAFVWTESLCEDPARPRMRPVTWTAAGVAVALFVRFEVLGYVFRARASSVAQAGDVLQHVLLVGRALATSIETLVFPWGTVGPAHHGVRPIPADDALGWTGLALGALLVALTMLALARRRRTGLLLVALVVSLAPASQIVPLDLAGGLHSADRFLYLPSFFAIATVASLAADVSGAAARAAAAVAGAVVVALAAGRCLVLPRWNDELRFWTWAVEMAPASDAAHLSLAYVHLAQARYDEAEKHARVAGDIATAALADALFEQGRLEEARLTLDAGLARRPGDADLRVRRGELSAALAQWPGALDEFDAAIRIDENRGSPRFGSTLARALAGSAQALACIPGRATEARQRLDRAEAIVLSKDAATWLRIARAWIALRDGVRAAAALDRAESGGAPPSEVAALRAQTR